MPNRLLLLIKVHREDVPNLGKLCRTPGVPNSHKDNKQYNSKLLNNSTDIMWECMKRIDGANTIPRKKTCKHAARVLGTGTAGVSNCGFNA